MFNSEIKRQTAELLSDYRDLTGTNFTPSITEFIALRERAVEEVRIGVVSERPVEHQTVPQAREQERRIRVRAVTQEEKKPADPVTERGRENVAENRNETRKPSDFELLKNLADPWN